MHHLENKTYIFERIKAKPDFIYVINDDFYAFGSQTCFIANKYYSFVKEAYENYQKAITSTDENLIKECYKKVSHEAKRIRAEFIKSTGKEFHTKVKDFDKYNFTGKQMEDLKIQLQQREEVYTQFIK